MTASAPYYIYSATPGEPNVSVWVFYKQEEQQQVAGQPVVLKADVLQWTATPLITGGGPTRLRVEPYEYTTDRRGEDLWEVLATNDGPGREWFLTPANGKDLYKVALDRDHLDLVWTAVEPGLPIRIEPFRPGDWNQVFKIVPYVRNDE